MGFVMPPINCDYNVKRGWRCGRGFLHGGPCALRPRWWNLSARIKGF